MKSKRTVFAVIVMVLCLIAAAMVIIGFVNNWQNETIIDFIIKTIGIPALVCVAGLFLIGCSQSKFSVTALYALLLGAAMSLLTNVIVVKNFTNDMITKMVENTPSHDSLAISTGESGGIGTAQGDTRRRRIHPFDIGERMRKGAFVRKRPRRRRVDRHVDAPVYAVRVF